MAAPVDVVVQHDKTFLCIEYPGSVVNVDKMLETLGGIENISKVYTKPTHRLELKYRPDDAHCKPAYGDRFNTTRVLLKVTKRRAKNQTEANKDFTCHSEILGMIDHTYKFRCMMDFQYLSMKRKDDGNYVSIIPEIMPLKLESSSWLQEPAPLLLTPIAFSRIDGPTDYHFRAEPKQRTDATTTEHAALDNLISRIRKKRAGYTICISYEDDNIPREPRPESKDLLVQKRCSDGVLQRVKDAFDSTLIWSKHALVAHLRMDKSHLKYILPAVAYYFTSGPWRGLWVKYGYDPRLDPQAKGHQILDFRVKKEFIPNDMGRSRSGYVLSVKFNSSQTKPATIIKDTFEPVASTSSAALSSEQISDQERYYKFRSGMLPPQRQMFYQLENIEVDEVQALIHDNDGRETRCTEKDGFCAPGILNKCRNIMLEIANKTHADYMAKNSDKLQEESMLVDGNEVAGPEIGAKKSSNVHDSEEDCESDALMPSDESDDD